MKKCSKNEEWLGMRCMALISQEIWSEDKEGKLVFSLTESGELINTAL